MTDTSLDRLANEVLGKDRLERLRRLFGASDKDWPAVLEAIASAALAEYADAFGSPMPTAEDIKQRRLLQLIEHGAFAGGLPTEKQVAQLFDLTPRRAQTLLRNVLGRFAADLGTTVNATLARELARATRTADDEIRLYTTNPLIIEGLQALLDSGNESGARPYPLERIVRDSAVRGNWRLQFDAYRYLCDVLGVQVAEPRQSD